MPPDPPGPASDPDRHGRRAVWIAALITAIGAGMIYADKAAEDRSAFIRWRHQVREMMAGANIYDEYYFPNPPIMPLTLYPLMALPPVEGALAWFGIKAALAAASVLLCLRMVRLGDRPVPSWVQAMVVLLSLRPIMSDLHHGNNNIMILFLVVATLTAWRKGYDVLAGLILAYAIAFKVTPGLFLAYFAYKRSWRTVGATLLGLGIFLLIVPSIFLGPEFNGICLGTWFHRILSPYVVNNDGSPQEINQSMIGVTHPAPDGAEARARSVITSSIPSTSCRGTRGGSSGGSSWPRSGWSGCSPGSAGPRRSGATIRGSWANSPWWS